MQFSLRWLMVLVTVCAVIAGLARVIPDAAAGLVLAAWVVFAGAKALLNAYRKCGPDSQVFRLAIVALSVLIGITVIIVIWQAVALPLLRPR